MRLKAALLALPSLLLLVACAADTTDEVFVARVLLGSSLNVDNEIDNPKEEFVPADHILHAHAVVAGVVEPTEIVGSWWYREETGPTKIYETHVGLTNDKPVGMFALQNTVDWPVGIYEFVVMLGAKELSRTEFAVR